MQNNRGQNFINQEIITSSKKQSNTSKKYTHSQTKPTDHNKVFIRNSGKISLSKSRIVNKQVDKKNEEINQLKKQIYVLKTQLLKKNKQSQNIQILSTQIKNVKLKLLEKLQQNQFNIHNDKLSLDFNKQLSSQFSPITNIHETINQTELYSNRHNKRLDSLKQSLQIPSQSSGKSSNLINNKKKNQINILHQPEKHQSFSERENLLREKFKSKAKTTFFDQTYQKNKKNLKPWEKHQQTNKYPCNNKSSSNHKYPCKDDYKQLSHENQRKLNKFYQPQLWESKVQSGQTEKFSLSQNLIKIRNSSQNQLKF